MFDQREKHQLGDDDNPLTASGYFGSQQSVRDPTIEQGC